MTMSCKGLSKSKDLFTPSEREKDQRTGQKDKGARLHSSKMRTARLLAISQHALRRGLGMGGVYSWGGVYSQGECLLLGVSTPRGCLLPGEVSAPGGCLLPGGVSAPGGVYSQGVSAPRGGVCSWGVSTPRGSVCSWGCLLPGGVCSQGRCLLLGVSTPRGRLLSQHALRQTPPPRGQTDMCKNTFANFLCGR